MNEIHNGKEDLVSILTGVNDERVKMFAGTNFNSKSDGGQTDVAVPEEPKDDRAIAVSKLSFEETSHHDITTEHSYFSKRCKVQHKCDDCGYTTHRKNTLMNHQTETCQVRRQKGLLASKNRQCKYCLKKMTHNSLRSHLRHFINALDKKRKPKGKHSAVSLQEFTEYLTEIKLKK